MGENWERSEARQKWEKACSIDVLAIDDLDKARFTPAWAEKLFDLVKTRNEAMLPTFWTANNGLGQLQTKIASNCQDGHTAAAIERRLCQGVLLLSPTASP